MFWKKSSPFPAPCRPTPYGERSVGMKGRASKGYTVENACAKWTGKGWRMRKMRVGEVLGLAIRG